MFFLLWGAFFYLGGGFESYIERLLHLETYQLEYELETFTLLNLIMALFIITMSKDIFLLDEPHILLIHKQKYIASKIIAYLLYYLMMSIIAYGVYQVIYVLLYGFSRFNYNYLIHLLFNVTVIHGLATLVLGQGKALLKMIVVLIVYLLLDRLIQLNHPYMDIVHFFYPVKTLLMPKLGYLHSLLYIIIIYILAYHKHINVYT